MSPGFVKKKDKDCFKEARYYYEFDRKIDDSFIIFLEKFGEVNVHRDFSIPLITMDVPHKLRLTALMGEKRINILFKKSAPETLMGDFERELENVLK